jgi:hypothetical protein
VCSAPAKWAHMPYANRLTFLSFLCSCDSATLLHCAKEYGEDHIELVVHLNNMGVVLAQLGREAEAQELFNRSLRIRSRELGPDHAQTKHAQKILDELMARCAEAERDRCADGKVPDS